MKLISFSGLLIIAMLIVMTTGCEKIVRGPQGPQGPQGEQGEQGPQGNRGSIGEPGTIDSVDVYYTSEWTHAQNWKDSSGMRYGTLSAPMLSQEVIDNGIVTVFYQYKNGSSVFVYKLPFKGTYTSPHSIKYQLMPGKIIIESTYDMSHVQDIEYFRYSIVQIQ